MAPRAPPLPPSPPTFLPPLEASSACFTPVEVQPACGAIGEVQRPGAGGEAVRLRLGWVSGAPLCRDVLLHAAKHKCEGSTCTRTLRRAGRAASGRAWAGAKAVHDMAAGRGVGWRNGAPAAAMAS